MSDQIDDLLKQTLPADAPPELVGLQRDLLVKLTNSQARERIGTATIRLTLSWTFVAVYGLVGLSSVVLWNLGALGVVSLSPAFEVWVNRAAVGSGFIGGTKFVLESIFKRRN